MLCPTLTEQIEVITSDEGFFFFLKWTVDFFDIDFVRTVPSVTFSGIGYTQHSEVWQPACYRSRPLCGLAKLEPRDHVLLVLDRWMH